jgi:hypothetical protein
MTPKLLLGAELLHRTSDAVCTPASSSVGAGFRYDLNETYHLLGYIRRDVENADQTDRYAWTPRSCSPSDGSNKLDATARTQTDLNFPFLHFATYCAAAQPWWRLHP